MIIIIGSVTIRDETIDEALRISQEHVNRSRIEAGCINHGVHIDNEDPNRLVFVERWESMEQLEQHFQVTESAEFAGKIAELASVAPTMELYHSASIQRH